MNKDYLYKVYNAERVTDYNRILDGDFEGVYELDYLAQWQSVGTPTTHLRDRFNTYAGTKGKGVTFDGVNDYLIPPQFGNGYGLIANTDFTIAFWFTKTSYAGMNQCFFDGLNTIIGNAGLKLHADGTNLIATVSLSGTYRTCSYALASIANGKHLFAMGSDGRYVRLFIDGVQVAQYDNTTDVGVYLDSFSPGFWFGRTVAGGSYLSGNLEGLYMWSTLLTAAQLLELYQTGSPTQTPFLTYAFGHEDLYYFALSGGFHANNDDTGNWSMTYWGFPSGQGNVTTYTGDLYKTRSLKIVTSTSGSAEQGTDQNLDYRAEIEGGKDYTAHAYFKATAGETVKLVITPYGGGAEVSQSVVATGNWQQISKTISASSSATLLKVKVVITNASASAKTFYVDRIALNDGAVAIPYFTRDNASSGTDVYGYDGVAHYHSYNTTTYLATWKDVVSDFKYDYEINSAGSQLTVTLARGAENTGEGTDLEFDLQLQVIQIDDDHPTGLQVFLGKIVNYLVDEVASKVDVVVIGYGQELDNFMLTDGINQVAIQPSRDTTTSLAYWSNIIIQTFRVPRQIKLRKLVVRSTGTPYFDAKIFKGSPIGTSGVVISGRGWVTRPAGVVLVKDSNFATPTNATYDYEDIVFDDVTLYPDTDYYLEMFGDQGSNSANFEKASSTGSIASPFGYAYIGGATINNAGFSVSATAPLYMEIWEDTGSTTVPYLSVDPSDILRNVLDNYQSQGGRLTYDSSIETTGTLVSYTFKSTTIYDALKKCLELAPAGWYFYINQTENKVYFKKKSTTPDHTFIIGKHFTKLSYDKRTDNIVNVIYFTGGDVGGYNLFKVYEDPASIELYGRKLLNYSDNRVTLETTADLIANTILENRSDPEVRVPMEVLQNYPIDTIKPGDVVTFRNNKGEVGEMSLWDVGNWDEMYWDYNVFNPATYELQIARFGRDGDSVNATLSTAPPDVNKRVEDINRNLEKQQTLNNPDQPIEGA